MMRSTVSWRWGRGSVVGLRRQLVVGLALVVAAPLAVTGGSGAQSPGDDLAVPVDVAVSGERGEPVPVADGVEVVLPPGVEEDAPGEFPEPEPVEVAPTANRRVEASSELVDVELSRSTRVGDSPVSVEFVSVPDVDDQVVGGDAAEVPTSTTPPSTVVETGGSVVESETPVSASSIPDRDEFDPAVPSSSVAELSGGGAASTGTLPPGDDDDAVGAPSTTPAPATSTTVVSGPGAQLPVEEAPPGESVPSGDDVRGAMRVDVVGEEVAAAAGLEKVAFVVSPERGAFVAGTRARVSIDYSEFRDAYGGDWVSRLSVVSFGSCLLVEESRKGCAAPEPVAEFDNDPVAGVISFVVDFAEVEASLRERSSLVESPQGVARPMGFARPAVLSTGGPGFGLSAGAYGQSGNFATTDLSSTGSWSVGRQAGDFNYSYPLETPAAPAGPHPQVSFDYSSQAVDGLTSDQNTQGGVMGPGWSMGEMFIERRFKSCFNDGGGTADLCHVDHNAIISMGGVSGELVLQGQHGVSGGWTTDRYRVSNAPGVEVFHRFRTDLAYDRGAYGVDNNREYYFVATPDGDLYYFGYGNRTGNWSPGTELKSVWTVPVRGLQPGEPCYVQSSRWCHQAYRWMLDRVETADGHVANYGYGTEKNYYGRMGSPNYQTAYVSGGRLEWVNYGHSVQSASSSTRTHLIDFVYYRRCQTLNSSCPVPTASNGADFPDIPNDQMCTGTTFCTKYAPTFFDRHVLRGVTTKTRLPNNSWVPVNFWSVTPEWVDPDGSGPDPKRIWIRKFSKSGYQYGFGWSGQNLGSVSFYSHGRLFANRVDYDLSAGVGRMRHYRIGKIRDEMGSLIEVDYTQPKPCPSPWPSSPPSGWVSWSNNTWSCFPRWWNPPSGSAGFSIWHKWVVSSVKVHDLTGISPIVHTRYDYPLNANNPDLHPSATNGAMAWHADTDRYVDNQYKSWGEYRGFFEVRETVGTYGAADDVTTGYRYFRGMDGDKTSHSGSGTKSVTVTNSLPTNLSGLHTQTDHDWFRGRLMERWTATSPTAAPSQATDVDGVVHDYIRTFTSGSDPRVDWVEVERDFTRSSGEYTRTYHSYDGLDRKWRFIEYGRTNSAYSPIADINGDNDDRCTQYSYTKTSPYYKSGLPARTTLHTNSACTSTAISDVSTFYDGATATQSNATNQTPVAGKVTATVTSTGGGVVDGNHNPVSTIKETFTYGNNGRQSPAGWGRLTSHSDARGNTTNYYWMSHANGAAITAPNVSHQTRYLRVTNPAGHQTFTYFDDYDNAISSVDANGRATEACYDKHGRVTHIYGPLDTKPTGNHYSTDCESSASGYSERTDYVGTTFTPPSPAAGGDDTKKWATRQLTKTAPGVYREEITILDGLARPVQTKTASPAGGIIATRTAYDHAGRAHKQSDPFHSPTATMSTNYLAVTDANIPTDTRQRFDSAGRVTRTEVFDNNTLLRQSDTTYGPWTTTVTPFYSGTNPYGATRTVTNAFGETLRVTRDVGGNDATTSYAYTKRGELREITEPGTTDAATLSYNMLGWQTGLDHNDAGATETRYYATGEVERVTDAEGHHVYTNIDNLGRPLETYAGDSTYAAAAIADNKLSQYRYDTYGGLTEKGLELATWSYQPAGVEAHRTQVTAVDTAGRVTNTRVWNPAADDPTRSSDNHLANPVDLAMTYTADGLVDTVTYPGSTNWDLTGDEVVTYDYSTTAGTAGLVTSATGDGDYLDNQTYDALARPEHTWAAGGTRGLRTTYDYAAADGRTTAITAEVVDSGGALTGTYASTHNLFYDPAGQITAIRENPDGTSGDERRCFTYDSQRRLTRALTIANPDGNCPTNPTAATVPGGPAAFNDGYTYATRDVLTDLNGRAFTYNTNVSHLPCSTGTDTTKPNAASTISAGDNQPAETLRYDCNGSTMSRSSNGQHTSYAWNENGRLEAVATGEPIAWTNLVNTTVDPASGDLVTGTLTDTGYTAGASSTQTLTGDGAISFRFRTGTTNRTLVGLNDVDNSTDWQELDFSIQRLPDGKIYIYESGIQAPWGPSRGYWFANSESTDVFTIERNGNQVHYLRNGTTFHTSTHTASGTYIADTSMRHTNSAIGDATITTGNNGTTRHTYNTNGQRTVRLDPDGTTTIYLDDTELRWTPAGTKVSRSYPGGGRRSFDGDVVYTAVDHHDSVTAMVDANSGTIAMQRYRPYGQRRAGVGVDDRGFLNAPQDGDGTVYLQHRHHQPATGMFLSVDPLVLDTGYSYLYGNANPVMHSDPSGLCVVPGSFRFYPDGSYSYQPMGGPECSDWDDYDDVERVEVVTKDSYGIKSDVKRVHHGPGGAFTGVEKWTLGVSSGFCPVFCLEVGVSSEGFYVRSGVGVAIDLPTIVIDNDAPECGTESTYAYVSGTAGPLSLTAGGESPGTVGGWNPHTAAGLSPVTGMALPLGGTRPLSLGAGVKHEWTSC